MTNVDQNTVDGFGDEWTRFDQTQLPSDERSKLFDAYFRIFPWHKLPKDAVGADIGCGSGRWALLAAPRVGMLHCVDPSEAIDVAKCNLADLPNIEFHKNGVDDLPFPDGSLDFAYSLGVLHHIPDTQAAMRSCSEKLKPGAPLLVYLYYAFDNRPTWFKMIWKLSEAFRWPISKLPHVLRQIVTDGIATFIYWPFSRFAKLAEKCGINVSSWPLSDYRKRAFYSLRTDALDRFGTRLEQRFSRDQIHEMMARSGLKDICIGTEFPYWCAVGYRA